MSRVLEFLGVAPHDGVAAFLRKGRLNSSWGNKSPEDVRKHKQAEVVPSHPWRAWSAGHKKIFTARAAATMRDLGYDPSLD